MSIAFLHSLLRNFVVYFGPAVIILFSLSLNLANTNLHKQAFHDQNFYGKLSVEMKKLDFNSEVQNQDTVGGKIQASGKQVYDTLVWSTIGQKLASPQWLEKVIDTNLDRVGNWLSGRTDILEFYAPTDEINQAVKDQNQTINQNSPKIPDCSSDQVQQIQQQGISSLKQFCIPKEIKESTGNLSSFLNDQFQKQTQGLQNQTLISREQEQAVKASVDNQIDKVVPDNYFQPVKDLMNIPITLRDYFLALQGLIGLIMLIYFSILAGLILSSKFFGKNPFLESGQIAYNLGLNTLLSTGSILLGLSILFLSSTLIKQFIAPSLQQTGILNVLGWQAVWNSIYVFSTALIISTVLLVIGIATKFILPKFINQNKQNPSQV